MEPKSPSPEIVPSTSSPEQVEIAIPDQEIVPALPQPEKNMPKHEQSGEQASAAASAQQQTQTTLVNPPKLVSDDEDAAAQDDSSLATVATDGDSIEKEWVEKAKNIIQETKNDPYLQEQKVSKLQADYLQKRYNKKVKLRSD